jgi:hypothetical protein
MANGIGLKGCAGEAASTSRKVMAATDVRFAIYAEMPVTDGDVTT